MLTVSKDKVKDAFNAEMQHSDVMTASNCSCINPTRMFWFTAEEIAAEVNDN